MAKEDKIQAQGVVIKSYPRGEYDVQLDENFASMVVRAYVSGNMRKNYISMLEGDTVTIELTPYDLSRGRIVYRGVQKAA